MIPWIQVYSNLRTHPKTYRLAELLRLKNNYEAVGLVVCLWLWASNNAPNGDLVQYPPSAIAEGIGWRKSPKSLVDGLQEAGWLDKDPLRVHDWEEYAVLLMESLERQKQKTRERVQKHRKERRNVTPKKCNVTGNVTETLCNAPTRPDHTLPNHTLPDLPPKSPEGDEVPGEKEFEIFWDRYPKKWGREEALEVWESLTECWPKVMVGLEAWLGSEDWTKDGGRYIPRPAAFLADRRWQEGPSAPIQENGVKLGDLERRAIARLLLETQEETS